MVHARKLGAKTLTFDVSGKLWRNSLIMQDRETSTLWSHITGEGLSGSLAGQTLEVLPSSQTTWSRWVAQHPETLVLEKSVDVSASRYESYFADPKRMGLFRTRAQLGKLPGKTMVQGVHRGPEAVAVRNDTLRPKKPLTVDLGEERVVLYRAADGGVRGWVLPPDLRLSFRPRDGAVVDQETGTRWDLVEGRAIEGPLAPSQLEEIPVRQAYWFAWVSFFPNSGSI